MTAKVYNGLVPKLRIGDQYEQTIELLQLGRKKPNLLNLPADRPGRNGFADTKGSLGQDHQAGRHIAKCPLQSKTDGKSHRSKHSKNAGGGYTELRQNGRNYQSVKRIFDQVPCYASVQSCSCAIKLVLGEQLVPSEKYLVLLKLRVSTATRYLVM